MSLSSGTGTTAEIVTLYVAVAKLEVMLRQYPQGDALGGSPSAKKLGRFTSTELDTAITAVTNAITAVNA